MALPRLLSPLFAALIAVGLARTAEGQTDSTRRDSVQTLPSLTVTAQRRSASPFAVPFATTVVRSAAWSGRRGLGLDDAVGMVPGVVAHSRSGTGDVRLVIRGFGARGAGDRSNSGTSRGIRVLIDGIPETEPDGRTSFDGVDLAAAHSIEIVRSNASSLWGNASGGLLSISTMPDFSKSYAETEVGFGGFGFQRYVGRMGATVGEGRFAGTLTRTVFDGWRSNSAANRWLANAALMMPVGSATKMGLFLMGSDNEFSIPGPLTQAEVDLNPAQANATYLSRLERRHNRVGRLGATVEHQFGAGGTLSTMAYINPKYLQRSERGTFRDFTRYHVGGNVVYANQIRLSGQRKARVMTGLDEAYQDGAILFYSLAPDGTRGTTLRDNKREGANNLGFFGQAEFEIDDRWALSLGGRYDAISYYYESYITPTLSQDRAFTRLTPKVAVNFRATPTHSFYANLGGGVEAPAGNETDPASTFGQDTVFAINPLLEPIRSTTFEIGTKQLITFGGESGLADFSYDVALYRTNVTNEIVPYRGGRFYFTAGKARRTGAEFGASINTKSGMSLQGMLSWNDHKYTKYQVDSVHYSAAAAGRFADFSGNKVVGVPDLGFGLSASISPNRWRGFRVGLGVQGSGRYFADDANLVKIKGYTLLNANVGLDRPVEIGGGATLRGGIGIQNLLDRRYIGSAFLNPDVVAGVPVAFEPGLPRSVVVSFAVGLR